ncbi:MAG TPA: sensor histidine kinase [Rhodocyclaceae bacterium]|nr:sensor histidine kinase [Rhodocyclaceae bacterium]
MSGLYYGVLSMGLLFNAMNWKRVGDRLYQAFLIYLLLTLAHVATMVNWFDISALASQSDIADTLISLSLATSGLFWNRMLGLEQRAPKAARLIKVISVAIGVASIAISFDLLDGLLPHIRFGAFLMSAIATYYAFAGKDQAASVQWETQAAIASVFLGLLIPLMSDLRQVPNTVWAEGVWHFAIALQMVLLHFAMDRRAREQWEGRKQMASELRAAQRHAELEKALRERHARWISIISHEFKTPLSIIDTTASSIEALAGEANELIQKRCNKIQRSVTRLNSLLTSYLAEERLISGVATLNPQLLDVTAFMERIMRGVLLPPEPPIELKLDLTDAPHQIYADRLLLQLMLNNLLGNAVKFSPHGGMISVCVRRKAQNKEAGIEFEVSDEGMGIRQDLLPHLFDNYVSGDDRLQQGDHMSANTGIGLWAVRESVNKHRGNIQVHSQPGVGTRFTIWLPVTMVLEFA